MISHHVRSLLSHYIEIGIRWQFLSLADIADVVIFNNPPTYREL